MGTVPLAAPGYLLGSGFDIGHQADQSYFLNPFEKFERKRFLYQCKDLNCVAFSTTLWNKLDKPREIDIVKVQMLEDLTAYYKDLGGIPDLNVWQQYWGIQDITPEETAPQRLKLVTSPPEELRFVEYVPYFDMAAAAGSFGMQQELSDTYSGWIHLPTERIRKDMFIIRIQGHSMEPRIPDGSWALFRSGDALGGSRSGRIMLVQHNGTPDPETGYSFTVKQYQSEKLYDDEGIFKHIRIKLISLNPNYAPIEIEKEDAESLRVVGEFVKVVDA